MNNLREVNDNILKDWFIYRDECFSRLTEEDKGHLVEIEFKAKFPAPYEKKEFC